MLFDGPWLLGNGLVATSVDKMASEEVEDGRGMINIYMYYYILYDIYVKGVEKC